MCHSSNVISTWASGTGAAGVTGALTYAALISFGFSSKESLLLMLIVPVVQTLAFFVLLRTPDGSVPSPHNAIASDGANEPMLTENDYNDDSDTSVPPQSRTSDEVPLAGIVDKLKYIPRLFKYILPLFTVYICEYFINQGLVSALDARLRKKK